MPSPLPFPRKPPAAVAVALCALACLAGCVPGSNPRPVPSVPQIGGDLKCSAGDHGYADQQFGWGFCYPNTWRYTEKVQATDAPSGVDLTFDITCLSDCKPPCPADSTPAQCQTQPGLFGYMIISTDDRKGASDLTGWLAANLNGAKVTDTISWGNSVEAVKLADGRRAALTPHNVVILDLHPSPLDLEGEMSSRLDTWRFTY